MLQLVLETYTNPRGVIARVLDVPVATTTLILVSALLACVLAVGDGLFMVSGGEAGEGLFQQPMVSAVLNFVLIVATAVVVDRVGRGFGGKGTYENALKVSVWYSAVSILPNFIFLALRAMDVSFTLPLQLAMMMYLVVIFSVFVQVLHGFRSLFLTVMGVFGAGFIFGMVLLFVLNILGFAPTP